MSEIKSTLHPMEVHRWSYPLPPDRIARYPVSPRDAARLLVYQAGKIQEDTFSNLARYLPPRSLLIFNDSRVVPARLVFPKGEIFLLEPIEGSWYSMGEASFRALVRPGRYWRKKRSYTWFHPQGSLTASYEKQEDEAARLRLTWLPTHVPLLEVLQAVGQVPLPPYLRRAPQESDTHTYQTVYARLPGSVAAPTAGLHFTQALLDRLEQAQINWVFITLHVGAGTFLPIRATNLRQHTMHAEAFEVSAQAIKTLQEAQGPRIAVGTTSMRTLESLYWAALQDGSIPAWVWEKGLPIPPAQAWEILKQKYPQGVQGTTRLLIAPGYPFAFTEGLITNFHQPCSTLLALVEAWIGDAWRKIYDYALAHTFRFLSYGDGSLLLR
ncbi:MAG: tRNA preQ1(34) S-adenosylmethionine ribosyltransferase-isomerase QueA [Bacteroidia bacterium]